jgi:cell division protein FtsX
MAFRSGITLAAAKFFIRFMLLGTIGLVLSSKLWLVVVVATAYVVLHFVVLPNWDERWFGVFYLAMSLCAATVDTPCWSARQTPAASSV